MSDVPNTEIDTRDTHIARPAYVVTATWQESAWHLTAELPGISVGRVVSSLDEPDGAAREMRTLIARRLGVADDSFDLELRRY